MGGDCHPVTPADFCGILPCGKGALCTAVGLEVGLLEYFLFALLKNGFVTVTAVNKLSGVGHVSTSGGDLQAGR